MSRSEPFRNTRPADAATAQAAAPGPDRLGPYRVERRIGQGSMGAVYLARDPVTDQTLAIKTLALGRDFGGAGLEEAQLRFAREARSAGRLTHPGIVTIFGSGQDANLAWIAMEYLPGGDLAHHATPAALLPVSTVLRVAVRVADALAYAHAQGVVHRDIKPANVIVDLAAGSVKLTDFGIARIAGPSCTRTGVVLGTPAFMSPEQLAGQPVDGRSDLYALGVTLFQLLTGRLPHEADSMAELMRKIAKQTAPDLRTLRPEIPEALASIVARTLEKAPERRPADGRMLGVELRRIADLLDASAAA